MDNSESGLGGDGTDKGIKAGGTSNVNYNSKKSNIRRRPQSASIAESSNSSNFSSLFYPNPLYNSYHGNANSNSKGRGHKSNTDTSNNSTSNNNELVPIWALAAISMMKKQNAVASTATSSIPKKDQQQQQNKNHYHPYYNNNVRSFAMSGVSSSGAATTSLSSSMQRELYPSLSSSVHHTATVATAKGGVASGVTSIDGRIGLVSKSEFSRDKQWIRSGNKWVLTGATNNNHYKSDQNNTISNDGDHYHNMGSSEALLSKLSVSSPLENNPTTIESWKDQQHQASSSSHHSVTTPTTYSNQKQSVISSSPSLLYARRRIAKTPSGFPYMPSLHLSRSSSSVGGGSSNNIDKNDNKIQRQRMTPIKLANNRHFLSQSSNREYQEQETIPFTMDNHNDLDSSGYDSESNIRERLKDWKEKYVQNLIKDDAIINGNVKKLDNNFKVIDSENDENGGDAQLSFINNYTKIDKDDDDIPPQQQKTLSPSTNSKLKMPSNKTKEIDSPPRISYSSRAHTDSFRSNDFEYDSDSNHIINRLNEWKKEQYLKSGVVEGIEDALPPRYDNGRKGASTPVRNTSRHFYDSPLSNIDYGYESGSTTCDNERLIEWKEKQYALDGIIRKKTNTTQKFRGAWEILATKSLDSLDSEDPLTRDERIKEWKEQFVDLPMQEMNRRNEIDKEVSGFFPITSPTRKEDQRRRHTILKLPPSPLTKLSQSLNMKPTGNMQKQSISLPPLTPSQANRKKILLDETEVESSSVMNLSSSDVIAGKEAEKDALSNAANLLRACPVIPPIASAEESMLELDTPSDINCKDKPFSQSFLHPVESWKPIRPESAFSGSATDIESCCSLNIDDRSSQLPIAGNKVGMNNRESIQHLFSWENCLFVRAEGARAGRICLSSSHLIFIYEDDDAEAVLLENGWSRPKIDIFLQEVNGSPARGATPVNIPPDESGEGGGVELIGAGDVNVDLLDLLEDGFSESADDKENLLEDKLSFDEIKYERDRRQSVTSGLSVSLNESQCNIIKKDALAEDNLSISIKNGTTGLDHNSSSMSHTRQSVTSFHNSCSPIDSPSQYDIEKSDREESFYEESYEQMLNQCIIRAMKAEAQRLSDFGRVNKLVASASKPSYNTWNNPEAIQIDSCNDFQSLVENETNVSSFSEPDLEVDPDEERRLYILGNKDSNVKFAGMKWPLHKLAELYDRRYMTREVGLEIFSSSSSSSSSIQSLNKSSAASVSSSSGVSTNDLDVPIGPLSKESIFLVIPDVFSNRFGWPQKRKSRRDAFVENLRRYAQNLNDVYWQNAKDLNYTLWGARNDTFSGNFSEKESTNPTLSLERRSGKIDALNFLMEAWRKGRITNYDYLLRLNAISGRSFHDPGNYPVMPWVLSNFVSTSVPDLSDVRNYRDLTKPMGALCPERLKKFLEKYKTLCSADFAIPPFMYGSHYSNTGGVVLHYLVRKRPFAGLHRQLQVRNIQIIYR